MNVCPYRVRVVHGLKPVDASQRIQFCGWMLKILHNGLVDPQLLFITDEAYFHISSYINSQDTSVWSNGNSLGAPDSVTWHKIGILCVVNAVWIVGPVFYHKALNSWLMMKDSMATFNKTALLCILHEIQWVYYKRCLMTESIVQDCGLQDCWILVIVTSVYGELKRKSVQKHTSHCWSSPDRDCDCFSFGWWTSVCFAGISLKMWSMFKCYW